MVDLNQVTEAILNKRRSISPERSLLVGVSGIDASGKGYITKQLEARITQHSIPVVNINVDGWLNLPDKRFSTIEPGQHFYRNAIRFDELFGELLLPLRESKSIEVIVDFAEENATEYRKRTYSFQDVGIVLVEGIFLFKRQYHRLFDLTVWVECSFFTALARALERKQEGLSAAATIRAYETIYFPAQRIHMERDEPVQSADLIVSNDPYLTADYEKVLDFFNQMDGMRTFVKPVAESKPAGGYYPSFH